MPHISCRQTTCSNTDATDGCRGTEGGKQGRREEIDCMEHVGKSREYKKPHNCMDSRGGGG
jgi:hypothetical protein